MASHSQHQQETSPSNRGGGGQAVVELCKVTERGLVFWSRQRFEIGAELQIRIRRDAVPPGLLPPGSEFEDWLSLSGYVVECPAVRRADGTLGFRVSLLLEWALQNSAARRQQRLVSGVIYVDTRVHGISRLGLN